MIPQKSALLELQRSIYNRLSASLSCPVYDEVPQGATFPYVAIGEDTAVDAGAKNAHGEEATVTLHVWSRAKGMSEAKGLISSIVYAMTGAPLPITGFQSAIAQREMADTFRDPDGITRHGVIRFRFRIFQEV